MYLMMCWIGCLLERFNGLGHNTVFNINLLIQLVELAELGPVLYFISLVANDKVGLNS